MSFKCQNTNFYAIFCPSQFVKSGTFIQLSYKDMTGRENLTAPEEIKAENKQTQRE